MAKTRAGPGRPPPNRRTKKNLENGLYVHSSPPKALNSNNGQGSASIRESIRKADIDALEEVVLQGHGTKLVNQPATDQRVRSFLKTVPSYMTKIDLIHDAVEKGNLRELKALLDRRKLARSKDAQGVGLLHKAVVHDHRPIVDYLITDYPETLEVTDNDGRTALHYCAASNFPDDMYNMLCEAVSDTQVEDNNGKTAADYMANPRELNVTKNHKKGSGGSKGKRNTPPKRNSPGYKIRTPPKREGMNITGANIRIWIHDRDLTNLEKIVYEGQGQRLLGETSNNAKVRQFLNLVPRMMTKIKEIHVAATNGDLDTLDAKADPPDILIAKDQNGLNPLHKSAALGLKEVSEWIVQKNQSTVFATEHKGRTPLFYAGVAKDGGEVYDMLLRSGADANHTDQYRKTADHYRFKPGELDVSLVHEMPLAPRGGGGSTLDIPGRSGGPSKNNSRAPSRNAASRNPSRRNSMDDRRRNRRDKNGSSKGALEYRDMKGVTDDEIEKYIRDGDLESLECIILSGRGSDLQGRSSWNDEVRRFLKRVPGYMEKVTSLHSAAGSGNITNVRRLTKENPKLSMARDKDGTIALHHGARSGDSKVTKYLHSLYPDGISVEDNDGRTPLHYAAVARTDDAYKLLEDEGADTEAHDLNGSTPEDYRHTPSSDFLAVEKHENQGRKSPRNKGKSRGPSKGPSRQNSKQPSRQVSRQNSRQPSREPSREPSRNGRSKEPSREPSRNGRSKEPSRSNSKAPSRAGSRSRASSPHATIGGTTNDIEVIAAIAAAEKNEDYKPLNEIIVRGDGDKLLGQTSKDPEVNEYLERVPDHLESIEELHKAVEEGESRKVMQLLDKRKKAQTRDRNHANILHKAVLHGHTDLVRYMVSSFPELMKHEDRAGRTPLHYAAVVRDGGHIYKIMEREGGDGKSKDNSGHSPEDYLNDPQILTQWDLKKELEEGIGAGGDHRPLTKGSEASADYYGDDEYETEAIDPDILTTLEEEYEIFRETDSRSLLKKFLTEEVFNNTKQLVTPLGATLHDCVKSGFANPDSNIGLYAPDADSYAVFHELFDPVIDEYHGGFGPTDSHPGTDFGTSDDLGDLNELGDYVVSTRVRCARSIEGYPFNPLLTNEQYSELEEEIQNALDTLEDDLSGTYSSLNDIPVEEQDELIEKHLLFKRGDRFLEAAGACRFWADGRGIFLNPDNTLVVWVNEEDHLRIISMQKGGDLAEVYDRFVRAVTALGDKLSFSFSQRLGFLSFCPTNLGTAIRASVHIRLPALGEDRKILEDTADQFNLQVRGTSGEHSEAKDFTFDISNRRRLGLTEIEALQEMYDGIKEIIRLEKAMEEATANGKSENAGGNKLEAKGQRGALSRQNSNVSEFPGMWSDEGQYLTNVLGDALIKGLSEVNEERPKDPISYLACCLYRYRYSDKTDPPNDTTTNDSRSTGSSSKGSSGSGHSGQSIAMKTVLDIKSNDEPTTPQTRDKNGQNVLHFAASRPHGRSAFYRLVAESGCNLADRNEQYQTPRDVASENDLQENVRAIDKWIINMAAEGQHRQLKKLLIEGYDHIVDVDDDQGNNIMEVALNKGQEKTVDFLRGVASFEEKRDWLHKAIRIGSLPHVQYIADTEDIAHAKDTHGRTSLHIATLCEEKEIMEFLATQYPELLKIGDNLERTPLHYAMAVEGVDQVAKVLVQAGARRAVKDLRGKQPSYYFMNRDEIVEMIKAVRKEDD